MKRSLCFSKSILFFAIMALSCTAIAQKVNNVQAGSVKAPAGVKIDGKLTEWGTDLQAYNKTTRLWYTMANDDQNIYLAIRSTDFSTNNKILAGGISLTINTAGKKKDKDAYVITFPVVNRSAARGMGRGQKRGGFAQQDTPDTAGIVADHKEALATCKTISAIGFKEITDTLISIYNEYGIKAVANFDDKGVFVYELSIPIKMLEIQPGSQKEIAYNVKLNGIQFGGVTLSGFSMGGGGGGARTVSFGGGGFGGGGFSGGGGGNKAMNDMADMMNPTDFWGKYTLFTDK